MCVVRFSALRCFGGLTQLVFERDDQPKLTGRPRGKPVHQASFAEVIV